MAKKTNYEVNGYKYYKTTATIGKKTDGTRIVKWFYGKSKKEAEDAKAKYLANMSEQIDNKYKDIVFYDAFKDWLFNIKKATVKASTFERYEGIYRNYIINSSFARKTIENISSVDIQTYYNNLSKDGKTKSQISKLHKAISPFFVYCYNNRYIKFNPCVNLIIPKDTLINSKDNIDPFADFEIDCIKNVCTGDTISNIFYILLGTGLRIGELLALTKGDINFVKNEINVNKNIKKVKEFENEDNYKYKTILQPPKTDSSTRKVPFPDNLSTILLKQLKNQELVYKNYGKEFNNSSLLLSTKILTYYDDANIRRAWQKLLEKANVRYRGIHSLRHTYATKLFQAGVPIKTVQVLLGHSDIRVTEGIYIHVMPSAKKNAVNSLNSLF